MASDKQQKLDGDYERRVKRQFSRPEKKKEHDLNGIFEEALKTGDTTPLEDEYDRRGWDPYKAVKDVEEERAGRKPPTPKGVREAIDGAQTPPDYGGPGMPPEGGMSVDLRRIDESMETSTDAAGKVKRLQDKLKPKP